MKLEHIAPYLPYDLDLYWTGAHKSSEDDTLISKLTLRNVDDVLIGRNKHAHVKPILRPLSDLTKEFEHNGRNISLIREWSEVDEIPEGVIEKSFEGHVKHDTIPHWMLRELFKHHFDVFQLIEKGEAIDINTLEG